MGDEEDQKRVRLPQWARRLLVIVSIAGPLSGAAVAIVSAIVDIRTKTMDVKSATTASYETLAPLVKELQDQLSKTQDVVNSEDKEIVQLKADKEDEEKRLIRLEAYVDILGRRGANPAPPPKAKANPKEPDTMFKIHKLKLHPVPTDLTEAKQYQDVRAVLKCGSGDQACDDRAAVISAPN